MDRAKGKGGITVVVLVCAPLTPTQDGLFTFFIFHLHHFAFPLIKRRDVLGVFAARAGIGVPADGGARVLPRRKMKAGAGGRGGGGGGGRSLSNVPHSLVENV